MIKSIIQTSHAPEPIGAYSQAILFGNTLYTSGQIALNPVSMELEIETIEIESKRVLENLKAILHTADMTFENVVKASVFVTNMLDFSKINNVYASYFDQKTLPAREIIQVAALPKNVNIEISFIAMK